MMYEIRIKCRDCGADPLIRTPKEAATIAPEDVIGACPLCGSPHIDYRGHVELADR